MYAKYSRIVCTKHKEENDDVKIWCEVNDGMYWVHKSRILVKKQFGIMPLLHSSRLRRSSRNLGSPTVSSDKE